MYAYLIPQRCTGAFLGIIGVVATISSKDLGQTTQRTTVVDRDVEDDYFDSIQDRLILRR